MRLTKDKQEDKYTFKNEQVTIPYREQFDILEYTGDNKDMLDLREQVLSSWAKHLATKM
tara:strand:- start:380 stop:556 length:177 start_codon:yes stop_codon:yes gene_type:complete